MPVLASSMSNTPLLRHDAIVDTPNANLTYPGASNGTSSPHRCQCPELGQERPACTCDFRVREAPCPACVAYSTGTSTTRGRAHIPKVLPSVLDPHQGAIARALAHGAHYTTLATRYGVSDACVRNFARQRGIAPADMHLRGGHHRKGSPRHA